MYTIYYLHINVNIFQQRKWLGIKDSFYDSSFLSIVYSTEELNKYLMLNDQINK